MDIRTWLFNNRMTNIKFAELVGVTPEYINKIKAGYKPSQFVCDAISRVTEGLVVLTSSTSIRKQKKAEKEAFNQVVDNALDKFK